MFSPNCQGFEGVPSALQVDLRQEQGQRERVAIRGCFQGHGVHRADPALERVDLLSAEGQLALPFPVVKKLASGPKYPVGDLHVPALELEKIRLGGTVRRLSGDVYLLRARRSDYLDAPGSQEAGQRK